MLTTKRGSTTTIYPNGSQLQLLRAGLLSSDRAIEEARQWLADHVRDGALSDVELSERRLLPLVYRNLKALLSREEARLMNPVHLEYWAANQKLFHWLAPVLRQLAAIGVPALVLKGVPVSMLYYPAVGCRPMSDADVLVPEQHVRDVVREFQADGWLPDRLPRSSYEVDYFYRHRHALQLRHPDGREFDLHWHVLPLVTHCGAAERFWRHSVPFQLGGVEARTPDAAGHLVHACLHGAFAQPEFPVVRWVADAVLILRSGLVNWETVAELTEASRVTIPMLLTLRWLDRQFDAGIPAAVIERLALFPVGAAERRLFESKAGLVDSTIQVRVANFFEEHRRATRGMTRARRMALLPRRLQIRWKLPSAAHLVPHALAWIPRQLLRKIT